MKRTRAVIWDMGGVFIRTFDPEPRRKLERLYGLESGSIERLVFHSVHGKNASLGLISVDQMWKQILEDNGIPQQDYCEVEKMFWEGDGADEELLNYIRSLRRNYRTGLISNAWSDARRILTEKYQCMDAFDRAVFSAEVGIMKPDPGIYWNMIHAFRIEPEDSVFIDDFPENVDAAKRIGMKAVLFHNPDQVISEINAVLAMDDKG